MLVSSTMYPQGTTLTHLAIRSAAAMLAKNVATQRNRFLIVITDGVSSRPKRTAAAANSTKAAGVTIFVVGVGTKHKTQHQ